MKNLLPKYKNIRSIKHLNKYLGRLPRRCEIKTKDVTIIIYDNLGSYLAANVFNKKNNIHVVSPQHILMYHLHNRDYKNYTIMKSMLKPSMSLPITYYGTINEPEHYKFSIEKFYDSSIQSQVPKNLYPQEGECSVAGDFDYSSPYFAIDGQEIKE